MAGGGALAGWLIQWLDLGSQARCHQLLGRRLHPSAGGPSAHSSLHRPAGSPGLTQPALPRSSSSCQSAESQTPSAKICFSSNPLILPGWPTPYIPPAPLSFGLLCFRKDMFFPPLLRPFLIPPTPHHVQPCIGGTKALLGDTLSHFLALRCSH